MYTIANIFTSPPPSPPGIWLTFLENLRSATDAYSDIGRGFSDSEGRPLGHCTSLHVDEQNVGGGGILALFSTFLRLALCFSRHTGHLFT
jgi:hypothetical protein